jgi:hypothetical protein
LRSTPPEEQRVTREGEKMDFRSWQSTYSRGLETLRQPGARGVAVGAVAAVALVAIGSWFALFRQNQPPPTLSAAEEPCTNGPGGERVGFLRTILLCPMDSPKCKADQVRVFRARRSDSWSAEAMLVPDIPDGYVITGGDLIDPSPYRLTNMGFNKISVTSYTNASDYCTKHYYYYLHANWISSEPSDRARIKICVYYDKWQGPQPREACPPPVVDSPQ